MANDDRGNSGPRGLLVALAAIVIIVVAAVVLVRELGASARLQDCGLSGRSNCAPIRSPGSWSRNYCAIDNGGANPALRAAFAICKQVSKSV